MASMDIKSLAVMSEVTSSMKSASEAAHAGRSASAYSQASNNSIAAAGAAAQSGDRGPAINMGPIYLVTPDGIVHRLIDDGSYSPEVSLASFYMGTTKI